MTPHLTIVVVFGFVDLVFGALSGAGKELSVGSRCKRLIFLFLCFFVVVLAFLLSFESFLLQKCIFLCVFPVSPSFITAEFSWFLILVALFWCLLFCSLFLVVVLALLLSCVVVLGVVPFVVLYFLGFFFVLFCLPLFALLGVHCFSF